MLKELLYEEYLKALGKKLEKSRTSYEIAKKDTIEAEGRMITRYDSTKTETAWLADGYLKEMKELERIISSIQKNEDVVNFGDCIEIDIYIKDKFVEKKEFFLNVELFQEEKELFVEFLCHKSGDLINYEKDGENVEYHIRRIVKGKRIDGVCMNSFVCLEDEDREKEYYYLVNYLGGIELQIEGKEVFCISKQAPMTQLLLAKREGDTIQTAGGYGYRILTVEQC